ncbi:MAG TPA: ribbon-helix-helix protein, CopG family [Thermoanaerobaculia bacterium]
MRTTITIDDAVLDDLKRRASQRGTTVSRLIEASVRLALARPPEAPPAPEAFELVTYGRGGRFTHLDVDRTSALLEGDDRERYGSRRP